jgi:hypothetical protein
VEALCILQRSERQTLSGIEVDEGDWKEEAGKMAGIYRNAYVTFAITSRKDCKEGFLEYLEKRPPRVADSSMLADENLYESIMKAPLSKLGWCFQEMLLPVRVLHFLHDEVVWLCKSQIGSESKTEFTDITQDYHISQTRDVYTQDPSGNQMTWWSWIDQYSSRLLTNNADRPAAIAGVIQYFAHRTGDEPVLGLWKCHL